MSAPKCLITGSEGFIGSHLADLLVAKGFPVYAMVYSDTLNIDHLRDRITVLECDLRDRGRVESIIRDVQADVVFHLAAQSLVTVSWQDPGETLETNVLGTFHLLEAIRTTGLDPVIVVVGSSSVYGPHVESDMPLGEKGEFRPTSFYAVSKVSEDMLGHLYWQVHGMKVIRVRPFNVTGPRKTLDACSDFARGIVEVQTGRREVVEVGNLEAVRDLLDGRDGVEALWLLAERGVPGEVYNLCSGKPWRMRDVLENLLTISGNNVKWRISPEMLRPYDDPIYVGENSKLKALGWRPRISLQMTLTDTLEYWRERLNEAGG
jgi:GDP-4-dehydro-6-deoxy-D-mannose reductase